MRSNKSESKSIEMVDDKTMVARGGPEGEGGGAAALEPNTTASHGQDVSKGSTATSSPDTGSPVMINVDVSLQAVADGKRHSAQRHAWTHRASLM